MYIILAILIVILIVPDIYIWLSRLRGRSFWLQAAWFVPSLLTFLLLFLSGTGRLLENGLSLSTALLAAVALPKFIYMVVEGLSRCLTPLWHSARRAGHITGLVLAVFVAVVMVYGAFFGWRRLEVKNVEISLSGLPEEFDGYRILQLSDLHVGTYGTDTAFVSCLVAAANSQNADAIVFTGDLVNMSPDELTPFEPLLSRLSAKDGVYSVLGNHDYCIYGRRKEDPASAVKRLVQKERNMGWTVLNNEHRIIRKGEACLAIAGVENTGKPPFPSKGDLTKALNGIPDSVITILLSHDPSHWDMQILPETDIPLTLSGHTHAAQVKIGSFSPSQWLYKEWSGLYETDGQQLFVSEGTGGTIAFRLGTVPQIIVFTLHKK